MVCAELMRSIASKPARCRALDPSSGRTFTTPESDLKSHALGRRAGRSKFVQEPPGRHGLHNIKPAPKAGWAIVGDPTGIPRGQLAAVPAKMRFTQSGPQHIAYLQRHDRGSVCKTGHPAAVCKQTGAAKPHHLCRDKHLRARRGGTSMCRSGFANRSVVVSELK